eukprot:jgi/Botrbrau1/21190/Bobra.0415s0001.1
MHLQKSNELLSLVCEFNYMWEKLSDGARAGMGDRSAKLYPASGERGPMMREGWKG